MMKGEPTEVQKSLLKLLENRRWFDENVRSLQKEGYRGKAIAVHDQRIVAEAETPEELKEKIRGRYREEETLMIVVPEEEIWAVPYPD